MQKGIQSKAKSPEMLWYKVKKNHLTSAGEVKETQCSVQIRNCFLWKKKTSHGRSGKSNIIQSLCKGGRVNEEKEPDFLH